MSMFFDPELKNQQAYLVTDPDKIVKAEAPNASTVPGNKFVSINTFFGLLEKISVQDINIAYRALIEYLYQHPTLPVRVLFDSLDSYLHIITLLTSRPIPIQLDFNAMKGAALVSIDNALDHLIEKDRIDITLNDKDYTEVVNRYWYLFGGEVPFVIYDAFDNDVERAVFYEEYLTKQDANGIFVVLTSPRSTLVDIKNRMRLEYAMPVVTATKTACQSDSSSRFPCRRRRRNLDVHDIFLKRIYCNDLVT